MNTEIVQTQTQDNIGFICLNKPPVNALGVALRTAIYDALQFLLETSEVKAIVLYGSGQYFSAGADIKDFSRSAESPTLPELLKALNNSTKPTVAALHGIAFGGALELAMATQLRVGITGVKVALPEVTLGLLPGAGGTQRLPRLVGIKSALDVICSARHVIGKEALEMGIISRLEDGQARDAGLRAAKDILSGSLTPVVTDNITVTPDDAAIEASRQRYRKKLNAPQVAIDAVACSTSPIDKGLSKERALFLDLMNGDERAGLVHAFFAERASSKIPEQTAPVKPVNSIGIIGGGTMGVGIATSFLIAGFPVHLIEQQSTHVEKARAAIETNLDGALKRGKLNNDSHKKAIDTFTSSATLSDLSQVDLAVEAIFENMEAKLNLFAQLDTVCKPSAILATNTSYLDINPIAAATQRAQQVIGMHFFSPAHIMRLVEVVVAEKTDEQTVATTFAIAKKLRKIPVRSGVCDGFIGNRILTQYRKCAEYLLLDGANVEQVDGALESFGFAMGPFAVSDLAGLDIARATRARKTATRPAEERYSRVADLICDNEWFGRKTGQGYYDHTNPNVRTVNPGAVAIVQAERESLGIKAKHFSDEDIVDRCMTAIMIESIKVLDEGIALRPVDIDAVKLFGYGFPRHRGGPMHLADQIGLGTLISRIEHYASEDPYFWQVPPLLKSMHNKGQQFSDFNT